MNELDESDLSLELDQNMINGGKGISVDESGNSPKILGPQDIQLQLLLPSDEEEEVKYNVQQSVRRTDEPETWHPEHPISL